MSITHKYLQDEHLDEIRVWIVDTAPNSEYFRVSQVPDTLTAGKNAFLIYGSPYLVTSTPVKVEVRDADGKVVFLQPIKNYAEGNSRVVSIEVYDDTAEGMATLTILGHLALDADGNLPPDKFVNAYNVKWQQRIPIAPRQGNTSPVRLIDAPVATVSEVLNSFRAATGSIVLETGSGANQLHGIPLRDAIPNSTLPNVYLVAADSASFRKEMEGGSLLWTVNGSPFTSSITMVVNSRQMYIDPGYSSSGAFSQFVTTDFSMSFSGTLNYTLTENTRSFANLTIKHLTTFSGDIYRIKVYASNVDSPANPQLVSDVPVTAPEMMVTQSVKTAEPLLRTGYFTSQSIISDNWIIDVYPTQSQAYNPT